MLYNGDLLGNHTIGVVKGNECYDLLKSSFPDIFATVNKIIKEKKSWLMIARFQLRSSLVEITRYFNFGHYYFTACCQLLQVTYIKVNRICSIIYILKSGLCLQSEHS